MGKRTVSLPQAHLDVIGIATGGGQVIRAVAIEVAGSEELVPAAAQFHGWLNLEHPAATCQQDRDIARVMVGDRQII